MPLQTTIRKVFDLLQAGHWLKSVITLGSLSCESNTSLDDVTEHWADEFKGDALQVWVERLVLAEEYFQRNIPGHYANTIDIVQSSGMGKSRLASEMGKKVMTISLMLREPEVTGFPPRDSGVLEFLLAGDTQSMKNTRMRANFLLGGTFFEGWYSSIPQVVAKLM